LIKQLIKWDILDKRKVAMDNLRIGLEHMGFLTKTKQSPNLLPLLVFSEKYRINAGYLRSKLPPVLETLKCDGDAKKTASKKYMHEWIAAATGDRN